MYTDFGAQGAQFIDLISLLKAVEAIYLWRKVLQNSLIITCYWTVLFGRRNTLDDSTIIWKGKSDKIPWSERIRMKEE